MDQEEVKLKRIEYLKEVIYKYLHTEPRLSMKEFVFAVCFYLGDNFLPFLKAYKKENKL